MEDKRIADHQITASSADYSTVAGQIADVYDGYLGRLISPPKTNDVKGWLALYTNLSQWLQVDFLHKVFVCAIATQGDSDSFLGSSHTACNTAMMRSCLPTIKRDIFWRVTRTSTAL